MEHDEYISEGYAMEDQDWYSKSFRSLRPKRKKSRGGSLGVTLEQATQKYIDAEKAKVGEEIHCSCCNHKFIKKTYQQKFHKIKCKDRYWNSVDPVRRERAKQYSK